MASGTESPGPRLEAYWAPGKELHTSVRPGVEAGQSHLITDRRMPLDIAQPRRGQSSGRRTPDEETIPASTNLQPPVSVLAANMGAVPREGTCVCHQQKSHVRVTLWRLEILRHSASVFSWHLRLFSGMSLWTTSRHVIRSSSSTYAIMSQRCFGISMTVFR